MMDKEARGLETSHIQTHPFTVSEQDRDTAGFCSAVVHVQVGRVGSPLCTALLYGHSFRAKERPLMPHASVRVLLPAPEQLLQQASCWDDICSELRQETQLLMGSVLIVNLHQRESSCSCCCSSRTPSADTSSVPPPLLFLLLHLA